MANYHYPKHFTGYYWNIDQKVKYRIGPGVMAGLSAGEDIGTTIHCKRELTPEEKLILDDIMAPDNPTLPPKVAGGPILVKDIDTWIDWVVQQCKMPLEYYVRKGADGYDYLEIHVPPGKSKATVAKVLKDLVTEEEA